MSWAGRRGVVPGERGRRELRPGRRGERRHPGVLPLRQHRYQRRDDGQCAAHPVPGPAVRAHADPVHLDGRRGPGGRGAAGCGHGRSDHPPVLHHRRGGRGARGAAAHEGPDHRLLRHPHESGGGAARRPRAPRGPPAARPRRRPALQQPDGGDRVRHRARRRSEPPRAGPGGRRPARAVPVRQDPDRDVPGPPARPVRGQLPPRRRGPGDHRPAPAGPRPRGPRLRADHHGDADPGPATTPLRRGRGRAPARKDRPLMSTDTAPEAPTGGTPDDADNVRWFAELGLGDLEVVGGKNSSLGEMISNLADAGVSVPDGFATTAAAYQRFLGDTGLAARINDRLRGLDTDDVRALAAAGREIRREVVEQPFPPAVEADIRAAYERLAGDDAEASFAVRSSATAEDLPDASFAGQQETFLNIRGIDAVLTAVREVYASLYNDRAIAYRVHHGFAHADVALSAGVQRMVRSDLAASGVMFTMDTESGFTDAVFVTSAYGLGEGVVQGAVNPDEFYVYKPALRAGRPAILKRGVGEKATKMVYTSSVEVGRTTEFVDVDPADRRLLSLTDEDVHELARQAVRIEEHYGRPMDIEWGKDGLTGKIFILQARPETVQSRSGNTTERYRLTGAGDVLVEGRAIGQKIGAGAVRVLTDIDEMDQFTPGDVLVADMTDPDWEPIMKRASAIVTNRGGAACHAAIIPRELGIPAV